MSNPIELKKITILGKVCNISSVILTIFLCLPLPIIFFFLKNTKKYFSILDSFEKYLNGDINLETLKKHIKHVFLRLTFLTLIFLFVIWLLFTENNSNDFEMRGNYIFATSFLILLLPCYYLCFKVVESIKNNGVLRTPQPL
jgi:hypothetical protein